MEEIMKKSEDISNVFYTACAGRRYFNIWIYTERSVYN